MLSITYLLQTVFLVVGDKYIVQSVTMAVWHSLLDSCFQFPYNLSKDLGLISPWEMYFSL